MIHLFTLFAVDRDKITEVSKQVFTGYLGDVSGKLNSIKNKIGDMEINVPTNSLDGNSNNNEVID